MVDVAQHNYAAASARTQEARANVAKFQADVERWQSEVKRLSSASDDRVINPQILAESQKQLKADIASRDAAKAAVVAQRSRRAGSQGGRREGQGRRGGCQGPRPRSIVRRKSGSQPWSSLHARPARPCDGIVVARNANTGDYDEPGPGDLSAPRWSPDQSASRGTPIYFVARTDKVRIYVDVPESEAAYVTPGDEGEDPHPRPREPGNRGRGDEDFVVAADPHPDAAGRGRPAEPRGRPAARHVRLRHGRDRTARCLDGPAPDCIVAVGEQTVCYLYEDGKAVRTPVRTGISDGKHVEVAEKAGGR